MDTFLNLAYREGILFFRHGHAHDLTSNIFQTMNLGDRTFNVARIRGRHGLHGDRRITPDGHISNMYLPGFPSHKFFAPFECL
jgi:hypothetical protein